MSWQNAQKSCQGQHEGASLAEPITQEKRKFVIDYMNDIDFRSKVWIGGKSAPGTNQFAWVNHKTDVGTTDGWYPGEPNSLTEECLTITFIKGNRGMNDATCSKPFGHLCQFAVTQSSDNSPDSKEYNGYSYQFHNTTASYSEARWKCLQEGSTIAKPLDNGTLLFLQGMAKENVFSNVRVPALETHHVPGTFWNDNHLRFLLQTCGAAMLEMSNGSSHVIVRIETSPNNAVSIHLCPGTELSSFCTELGSQNISSEKNCQEFHPYDIILIDGRQKTGVQLQYPEFVIDSFTHGIHLVKDVGVRVSGTAAGVWYFRSSPAGRVFMDGSRLLSAAFISAADLGTSEGRAALSGLEMAMSPVGDASTPGHFLCQKLLGQVDYVTALAVTTGSRHVWVSSVHTETARVSINVLQQRGEAMAGVLSEEKQVSKSHGSVWLLDAVSSTDPVLEWISVSSSLHVAVVVFVLSSGHAGSSLILPSDLWTSSYFLMPPSPNAASRITSVSLHGRQLTTTNVLLTFPAQTEIASRCGVMSSGGLNKLSFQMKSIQSFLTSSRKTNTGVLFKSDEPVAISVSEELEDTAKSSMDNLIPVEEITPLYVTVPTPPFSDERMDRFLVTSPHDNTEINVAGASAVVTLKKVGDVKKIFLQASNAYVLSSDHAFFATKTPSDETKYRCSLTLIPASLWKAQYSYILTQALVNQFQIYVTVIIPSSQMSSLQYSGVLKGCRDVAQSDLSVCHIEPSDNDNVISSSSDTTFAAYMHGVSETHGTFCHALGTSESGSSTHSNVYSLWKEGMDRRTDVLGSNSTQQFCSCRHRILASTFNQTDIAKLQEFIIKRLAVNVTQTSAYLRSKTSQPDDRQSSAYIGYVGCCLIALTFALLILSDVITLTHFIAHKFNSRKK